MIDDYELIDNEAKKQYEYHIDGQIARIEYIKTVNNEIFLTHTEVPEALEGRGIASSIIGKALADVERQGLRLVPLCPFVAGYIQRHPEWKRLVLRGINI